MSSVTNFVHRNLFINLLGYSDRVYNTDLIIINSIHNYLYLQSEEFISGAFLKSDQFSEMHSLHNSLYTSVVKLNYMPFYLLLSR